VVDDGAAQQPAVRVRTFRPRNRNVKASYTTASVILADRIVYQNCST
jgi:hypothetical protein